jgi:hypothetical protein
MKFVWVKRTFEAGGYNRVEEQFAKDAMRLGDPKEMLMILVDVRPLVQTIYMRLPETLASTYPGFELISDAGLPKEANLLFGDHYEFLKHFKFPTRRL